MAAGTSIATRALRTAAAAAASGRRGLRVTAGARLGLKESSQAEGDYDCERHKRDSLAKQRRGAGHWKPELASDSEEAVRADRQRAAAGAAGAESVARLQERTKAAAETRRAGTSVGEGM